MLADEILSRLEILPVEELKIHEQTLPQNLTALREKMLNHGRLVDPLIVDKKHHVVLDGNHRRMVLEMLKSENAVCQSVDYEDDEIKVGGWYPAFIDPKLDGLEYEKVDYDVGMDAIKNWKATFFMLKDKKEGLLFKTDEEKLQTILKNQAMIITKLWGKEALYSNGVSDSKLFIEDSRIDEFLKKGYSVFIRRNFTKEEIIEQAIAGNPLPPKSTRHIIPNRIVRLNFRLGYLNEPITDASIHLRTMIKKRVKYGSARYYTEPLIVLY